MWSVVSCTPPGDQKETLICNADVENLSLSAPFPFILSGLPFRPRDLYKLSMKGGQQHKTKQKKWLERLKNKSKNWTFCQRWVAKRLLSCSAGSWSIALTLKFYFSREEWEMYIYLFSFFSEDLSQKQNKLKKQTKQNKTQDGVRISEIYGHFTQGFLP